MKNLDIGSFLVIVLAVQFSALVVIFFDIPVARQVVGFIYLAFIPGFVIVKLLKQDNLELAETVLFSVGLSLAIIMVAGLIANGVGSIVGIKQPLESSFMVLVLSCFVLLGAFACYFRGSRNLQPIGLTKGTAATFLVLFSLPVLSILGAYFANVTGNTIVLILDLLMVLTVFVVAVFSKRLITPKIYLIIVFVIAIALLFQYSLTSNYAQGFDIKIELYGSTLTQSTGYWNYAASFSDLSTGKLYSMISVTILPTIFSNILNMSLTWIFKIVYPIIFALVPLGLYLLWRGKFGLTVAFCAVFLFVSQVTFYTEMLGLARQMIAEVFFVLLFLIFFSQKLRIQNAKLLFVLFSFCLVISHYSIAIMFAFYISLMWLIGYFTHRSSRRLNLSSVIIFLVLMFLWFVFTISSATMISVAQSESRIVGGFSDFFNPAFRDTVVLRGIGAASVSSQYETASRIIAYATEFFIVIGFLKFLFQLKKKDFDFQYFIPCFASILLLMLCILVPNFASAFNMTRFYHFFLFFLAPLFAIGCIGLFRFAAKLLGVAAKKKTEISGVVLMILLLGSYFLFQTSFVYEVTGEQSWSLPLSQYRLGSRLYSDFWFVTNAQVNGSRWLTQNTEMKNLYVHADSSVINNLVAYGGIPPDHLFALYDISAPKYGEFVYLGELSTVYNTIIYNYRYGNASELLEPKQLSTIYNNGFCEILTGTI